jgi:hypothetical protein
MELPLASYQILQAFGRHHVITEEVMMYDCRAEGMSISATGFDVEPRAPEAMGWLPVVVNYENARPVLPVGRSF